jgi:lysophospholipase L1-like esterase
VTAAEVYEPARGYGFEGEPPRIEGGAASSEHPFLFSADVPEGDYRVTVVLGGPIAARTTVKAELRRLMLQAVSTRPGQALRRQFIVDVRTPAVPGGGRVQLKAPRETVQEAVAWDNRLTLEFNGEHPSVREIRIEPVRVPVVYILGDSTVADQPAEPYASWGQMLPAFFKPDVAVANHAESGESVSGANRAGRFRKILAQIRPGDWLLVQFGHNDMKERAADPQAPQKYEAGLEAWVRAVQAKGGHAVLITSMNRHTFSDGQVTNSLLEYPELARQAARATEAGLIDLNSMSKALYEALGEQGSWALFEHSPDYRQKDGTHHSPYGAYELANLVVEGIRQASPPLARHLRPELPRFDPRRPDSESAIDIPPSPAFTTRRPLGD